MEILGRQVHLQYKLGENTGKVKTSGESVEFYSGQAKKGNGAVVRNERELPRKVGSWY